jgi:arsenate reductase
MLSVHLGLGSSDKLHTSLQSRIKAMGEKIFNVLFLCTCNSARSLIAEAQLNALGKGRFKAYSAGSYPTGTEDPVAIQFLRDNDFAVEGLRSKSWDEFAVPGAPVMDYVLTLCDDAYETLSPVWPGQPVSAHWHVDNPLAVQGDARAKHQAIVGAAANLRKRIELFVALPTNSLDRMSLQHAMNSIGTR